MLEFAADLFPDTGGVVPGCTPTEWLAGRCVQAVYACFMCELEQPCT